MDAQPSAAEGELDASGGSHQIFVVAFNAMLLDGIIIGSGGQPLEHMEMASLPLGYYVPQSR